MPVPTVASISLGPGTSAQLPEAATDSCRLRAVFRARGTPPLVLRSVSMVREPCVLTSAAFERGQLLL